MDIRIDKSDNGFRVRWHHNGQQGREQFATDLELKAWLARFDYINGRAIGVDEEAARSFGVPEIAAKLLETIEEHDEQDRSSDGDEPLNGIGGLSAPADSDVP